MQWLNHLALFSALTVLACSAGGYEVRVLVEPSSLLDASSVVEVALVPTCEMQPNQGRIAGQPVLRYRLDGEAQPLGDVDAGEYGLFARLSNDACEVVAAGCVPVRVESGGTGLLTVTVTTAAGNRCGTGESCAIGECSEDDASVRLDAGADVTMDGTVDAIADAARDTTECGPCATEDPCEEALCEGDTCVIRPLEEGDDCGGGTCRSGACCIGCWDGATCQDGETGAACGAGGGSCATCACPNPTCDAGACTTQPAFRSVGMGTSHACYVLANGSLYCAGSNDRGQLGTGVTTILPTNTVQRVGEQSDWTAVAVGFKHTCGLRAGGALYCWGDNRSGQIAAGASAEEALPTRIDGMSYDFVEASSEANHTFARRTDGTWWAFGRNDERQLNLESDPGLVLSAEPMLTQGGDWLQVSIGNRHGCGIAPTKQLYCWGFNDRGQIGVVPVADVAYPATLMSATTDWVQVDCGLAHTCAINEAGEVYCVGSNSWRLLGRATPSPESTSFESTDATGRIVRLVGAWQHLCALDETGQARCWGENMNGVLGFGHSDTINSLLRAPHFDDTETLSFGRRATFAYLDGNSVWGTNSSLGSTGFGRLGLGHFNDVDTPTLLCIDE